MDIREIDVRDEAQVRRHWEIGKAAEDAVRPYDWFPAWESARRSAVDGLAAVDVVRLGLYEDGAMWSAGRVDLTRYDNLHTAACAVWTHPERERRGFGRAMAEAAFEVAQKHGRRLMLGEAYTPVNATSTGLLFGRALGFRDALVDGMKVVDLCETEPRWDGLEAGIADRHAGYTIRTWRDAVPEDLVEGYCRLNETFFAEAPTGDLEVENERWDEVRVRDREQRNARAGRHDVSAGAVAPDGALVGLTEVVLDDVTPERGIQSGTLVAPEHRGHALGLGLKLANHRQLREHHPELRRLLTGNADVNVAMNAVNETLGYREVERCVELQRPL